MSKSKLKTRTITGALYGIVFISSLIFGELSCSLFFLVVMLLAIKEFYALVQNEKTKPQVYLGMLISLGLFASSFLYFKSFELSKISFAISCFLVLLVFILELFRKESVSYSNIGLTLMGVIYISIPMSLTFFLSHNDANQYDYILLLSVFILIWMSDVGGYFAGVNFGKHKLLERISPKKSWEGVAGGFVLCIISSIILSNFVTKLDLTEWIILGIIICISSVIGDLIESMIKRTANVKDSGTILPGHGGILDRFDSALLVIPIVYIYIILIS